MKGGRKWPQSCPTKIYSRPQKKVRRSVFFEDAPWLMHRTVTTVRLPNKTCCLNIKATSCFFAKQTITGIIFLFLQGEWDKQPVPVVTSILEKPRYPCEGGALPTSQPATPPN